MIKGVKKEKSKVTKGAGQMLTKLNANLATSYKRQLFSSVVVWRWGRTLYKLVQKLW